MVSVRRFAHIPDSAFLQAADASVDYAGAGSILGMSRHTYSREIGRRGIEEEVRARLGGPYEATQEPPKPKEIAVARWYDASDYAFTGTHYVFTVSGRIISVPKETWENVCRDYSDYGGQKTRKQIALDYGVPLKALDQMLASYQQYHASPPFSRERVAKEAVEPLVEEALEYKEQRLLNRIQKSEYERVFARNRELEEKLSNLERLKDEYVGELESLAPALKAKPRPVAKASRGEPWTCHAPCPDLHLGKFVRGKEDYGENYDTKIGAERLVRHGYSVASFVKGRPGCQAIYLTDLGDLLHALQNRTDGGTPLQQDTRGKKVWRTALEAKIAQVEAVRGLAPVRLKHVEGNHGGILEWLFAEALALYYRDAEDVVVETTEMPQTCFLVGTTLHVLDHGKGVGSPNGWKGKAQADVVARETAGEDYFKARSIIYYVGHLHELAVGSHGKHMELVRLPSWGESDSYESGLRYASLPVAHIYALDARGRIDGDKRLYLND